MVVRPSIVVEKQECCVGSESLTTEYQAHVSSRERDSGCRALKAAEGQPLNAGRSRRQGGVGEAVPTGGRPARAPPRGGEPHRCAVFRSTGLVWVSCTFGWVSCTFGWVSCTFGEVARSKPATEKNRRRIASNSLQCLQPLWGCSVESEKAVEGAVAGARSVASRKLVQPPLNAEKTGCVE